MNCNDGLCSVGWLADEIGLVGSMNENENEMRTRGIGQYVHSDLDSDSGKARIKRSQKTTKKKGKKNKVKKNRRKRKNKESALYPIPIHKESREIQEVKKWKRVPHRDDRSFALIALSWQAA